MELTVRLSQRAHRAEEEELTQKQTLLNEIREVSRLIACNDEWFEQECNEDLIEACVYQGQSLQARYRYLLQQARREGLVAPPLQNT